MEANVHVNFYLVTSRINENLECPIFCRITVDKKRKDFSTGIFVNELNWDRKRKRSSSSGPKAAEANTLLAHITSSIQRISLDLKLKNQPVSALVLYNIYKGNKRTDRTLLALMALHNNHVESQIGNGFARGTWKIYKSIMNHVIEFIKHDYNLTDIGLSELDLSFINDFHRYLRTVKHQQQVTSNKLCSKFKKVVRYGIQYGWIEQDPFVGFKTKKVKNEVVFLIKDELDLFESIFLSQKRLENVRLCFLFSCYTGLAYTELRELSNKHIIKGFDDNFWINIKRQKTDKLIKIPMLRSAIRILEGFGWNLFDDPDTKLLPMISNQKMNSYLKEIAAIIGVEKKLTCHQARKTFASTVLLYNDVPMEVVSELLGHSKISTTQDYYGKVVDKKLSQVIRGIDNKE